MRQLYALKIAFFGPTIEKKYRSPNGRFRTSYVPVFSNYVFVFGNEDQRYSTMTTNCVSRYTEIQDRPRLFKDLCQVHQVLSSGVAITQEQKLSTGDPVVVKNGPFKGFEGRVSIAPPQIVRARQDHDGSGSPRLELFAKSDLDLSRGPERLRRHAHVHVHAHVQAR